MSKSHNVENPKYTNQLIHETSPYLLQHAHNPVNWYGWNEEAINLAKSENKPIHLSVGYSSCHWCHRLSEESFEDEKTAEYMNENFVNIKVDREERPDLDSIYMAAVQAMTGHGGWPMTVFLTPQGEPFFGGTYFPPEPRYGLPSFRQVLEAVVDAYHNKQEAVRQNAAWLTEKLQEISQLPDRQVKLTPELMDKAAEGLARQYDAEHGGFGSAPKFPQAMALEVLLRHHARGGSPRSLEMVRHTLTKMARGGMYDQLAGGFHRYSVDNIWLVPHFEKMLYDNALLSRLYLEAHEVTGDPFFRRIAEECIDYVLREMTAPEGGFYSTEDADSEGEEGKFYVWSLDELRGLLGDDDADVAARYWGVTAGGNFEGHNILNVPREPAEVAAELGLSEEDLAARIAAIRPRLLEERARRVRPGRDEKIVTSWNGMMLRSVAEAGRVLGRQDYVEAARRNGDFLLTALRGEGGKVLRTYKDGHAKIDGFLEDYANLIDGLIELYHATFELRWMRAAGELAREMLRLFWDAELGSFFDAGVEHEQLITRPRDPFDNATPSGTSVAADVLLRLAVLLGEPEYDRTARAVLESMSTGLAGAPGAFGRLLAALDFHLATVKEVAIVGQPGAPATEALVRAVFGCYLPNKVVALAAPGDEEAQQLIPLLQERPMVGGAATAYVCFNYTCQAPTTDPAELERQLEA